MAEFKWVEKITDKVWVAFLIWVGLAIIANAYAYLTQSDGTLIHAALQLVGLFIFLKALWKWYKRRQTLPHPIVKGSFNQTLFITGLLVVLAAVVLIYGVYTAGKHYSSNKEDKYMSCMLECEDAKLTKTQDSICKVNCIKKYK